MKIFTDTENTGDAVGDPEDYCPDSHSYTHPDGTWEPAPAYESGWVDSEIIMLR